VIKVGVKEIRLDKEQAEKFLMCFFEDAKKLAIERQTQEKEMKEEVDELVDIRV
jgi:hypothetical protein